jgi:hypothetical protein
MAFFKNNQNKLFYIDDINHIQFLSEEIQAELQNSEQISAQEAAVLQAPSIEEIKQEKWQQIKAKRDFLTMNGGYLIAGKWFHSDEKSRIQQLGLLQGPIPSGLYWKTMDGSFQLMTTEIAQAILSAAIAQDKNLYTIAEIHKAAMENSSEPENYDFSSGWPNLFVNE